jgi:hypothetical protein
MMPFSPFLFYFLVISTLSVFFILTAWLLWKHHNTYVFDRETPFVSEVLQQFRDEYKLWCLAGAKKLQALGLDGVGTLG